MRWRWAVSLNILPKKRPTTLAPTKQRGKFIKCLVTRVTDLVCLLGFSSKMNTCNLGKHRNKRTEMRFLEKKTFFYSERVFSYHEQCKHGLANVEAMPPVVVGDLPVTFTD